MTDPMAVLRTRFLQRSREDLEVLRRPDLERHDLAVVAHRLSGAAGMFGFPEVSRLAARLDDQIHAGEPIEPAALKGLIAGLQALPQPS